jgi:hypothetical protein
MSGSHGSSCAYISRYDLFVLTGEAAEISGITYAMDIDRAEAQAILKA